MITYTIKKNHHYSNFFPTIIRKRDNGDFCHNVIFQENCKYSIEEKSCVNKLFGFSMGLFGVHKDSVRFGWTYNKETDKIEIWSYVYDNGKLYKNIIYYMNIGDKVNLKIGYSFQDDGSSSYELAINGKTVVYKHVFYKTRCWKFLLTLGFYFGGKTKAPNRMDVIFD